MNATLIIYLLIGTLNPGTIDADSQVLGVSETLVACEEGRLQVAEYAKANNLNIKTRCTQVIVGI